MTPEELYKTIFQQFSSTYFLKRDEGRKYDLPNAKIAAQLISKESDPVKREQIVFSLINVYRSGLEMLFKQEYEWRAAD